MLELRELMQCEDKEPTLYQLAFARRGCWIIHRILISIPDCHSQHLKKSPLCCAVVPKTEVILYSEDPIKAKETASKF